MKVLKRSILILTVILTISIGFFISFDLNKNINYSVAEISNLSGEEILLVGKQNEQPESYFFDEDKESTLSGAIIYNKSRTYINKNGQSVSSYYSIDGNSKIGSSKYSNGYVDFQLTQDMMLLANKGILYVQANAGVLSYEKDENDKIEMQICSGNNEASIQSSGKISSGELAPEWIETEFIKVDPDELITFYFTTLEKGNSINKCNFSIFEPKLLFKVIIDGVDVNGDDNQEVSCNSTVNITGSNVVVETTGSSEYLKYYRYIHRIQYEILEGNEYAQISSVGKMTINKNAPDGLNIKIRLKSIKDSLKGDVENNYVYSKTINYIVSSKTYEIKIKTDFNNPAIFYGEGKYVIGKKIMLRAEPNNDFEFKNWVINGESVDEINAFYEVKEENEIKCNFIKKTRIRSYNVKNKIYDGTNKCDCNVELCGIEDYHNVGIENVKVYYESKDVGQNKKIIIDNSITPVLTGKDSSLYKLDLNELPNETSSILEKAITVKANEIIQTYGDSEEILGYIIEGDVYEKLSGELSRQTGSNIGSYEISIGSLQEKNPNYAITFVSNFYKIIKRELSLSDIKIDNKVYDGTKDVKYTYSIKNKIINDDVDVVFNVEYPSKDVGKYLLNVTNYYLQGKDKDNYILKNDPELYAEITKKKIIVKAQYKEVVFGEEEKLTYTVEGLVNGDKLDGELSRIEGNNVGEYDIFQNTLNNTNYQIEYHGNILKIIKRKIYITANDLSKTYGDLDDSLTYKVENMVEGENLLGNLEREKGELCGEYKILQGTLSNNNYDIEYTAGKLIILPRKCNLKINLLEKEYDGTVSINYTYSFDNLVFNDKIAVDALYEFEDAFVGKDKKVIEKQCVLTGENIKNYDLKILCDYKANINVRNVSIEINDLYKEYGDPDPIIKYKLINFIEDDILEGVLYREPGENTGKYEIICDDIIQKNENYKFNFSKIAYLNIEKVKLNIIAEYKEKIFGESDPELTYLFDINQIKFDDKVENIITGSLTRTIGDLPGRYTIKKGSLASINSNYIIGNFKENELIINKKEIYVKIDNQTKIYGEDDPQFTFSVIGLVENNNLNIIINKDYGENVGRYELKVLNLNDYRYQINIEIGYLNIAPREITIKADSAYKVYGDEDPDFSVSVVSGILQFNENIDNIFCGQLKRKEGEDIGEYLISIGDFNLGSNYTCNFESGSKLNIIKQDLIIQANNQNKIYGDSDLDLTYSIIEGSLKFNDCFSGKLKREIGETIGEYNINIGSLVVNNNYNISYKPAKLIIEKRPLTITADAVSKFYGDVDPIFTYKLNVKLFFNDVLTGCLYREKDEKNSIYENSGKYLIYSNLNNQNYDIEYIPNYLTIKQREINISANNVFKNYGEKDPELTYNIESGDILAGDQITGYIYRIEGESAGNYEIRSRLSLGRNYKIIFTKGIFEIKPIDIYIRTPRYEIVYGDTLPTFEYEIYKGQLFNNDLLLGGVQTETINGVGKYKLISVFTNENYNVILDENYLVVTPKTVFLNVTIYDKVYNGDDKAYIKQTIVTGLIDEDIEVQYDKENSARFTSVDVGNKISVKLYNIALVGEKSRNYILNMPNQVYGNITHSSVSDENQNVIIQANESTSLKLGTEMSILYKQLNNDVKTNNKQVVSDVAIQLQCDNQIISKDTLTIKIKLDSKFIGRKNYYVYGYDKSNNLILLNSKIENNYISFSSDNIKEFIILTDNELWIDIMSLICLIILLIIIIIILIKKIKNKQYANKKRN